jgi:hypothetical protein
MGHWITDRNRHSRNQGCFRDVAATPGLANSHLRSRMPYPSESSLRVHRPGGRTPALCHAACEIGTRGPTEAGPRSRSLLIEAPCVRRIRFWLTSM